MSTFLFTRPSENLARTATVTVNTGVEDAAYPKANIADHHPEKPAKLTGTTGSFVYNLGSAKRADLTCVGHHNLAAGVDLRLQANATDTWGAPTVDLGFTIPARYADNFTVNVWLNLATLLPSVGSRTFQFWRLLVNSANSAPVAIGEWLLYSQRRDLGVRNIKWGSERTMRRPATRHETDLLVRHTYDFGTTVRAVEVEIDPTDATLVDVQEWFRDAKGIADPFVIIPHKDETDAWIVTFDDPDQPYKRVKRNYNTATLRFQEMSRGLFP